MTDSQVTAVLETRLIHDIHRRATSLLAEAAARPSAPPAALAEVRDFLVAHLHHHHESEDDILWPMIKAKAPTAADPLAGLSDEHDRLDAALDALGAAPMDDSDRTALLDTAVAVRDLVHLHLEHEEPALFPALRDHVSEAAWAEFSQHVMATTPQVGMHLLVGFLEQVGTPEEVEMLIGGIPAPVRTALREQAQATFDTLRAAG
ncbi:hemerythrin domain-containing protein [Nonomuraea sp. K274]|uniref:Hemerythrin domain-containing protein n=1 Tax=Nonomuraea cypriaca TaxID=1187855 RepID=A0A931EZ25_9ACTN|nr:hemerythrin domain-containing protein [Nonomuraea cypriaca]MBF8185781.1 hemerythrin domain-containing protein [Nonomuraea cypriaca]